MEEDFKTIRLGNSSVGIIGLKGAFETIEKEHLKDEEKIKEMLLALISQKKYIPSSVSAKYKKALYREYRLSRGEAVEEDAEEGFSVKILGPGCYQCGRLMEERLKAFGEMGIAANVEHITDLEEIARYGFVPTPGLVINKKLKSAGKILFAERIKKYVAEELEINGEE